MGGFEGEGLNVNRRVRGRQRRPPTSPGNKESAAKVRHQGRELLRDFHYILCMSVADMYYYSQYEEDFF